MESSTLKILLESQEGAFKSAMEIVVKQMNDQINKMECKVSDLITSLEFTQREVDDLKSEIKDLEKEKKDAKTKIGILADQAESSDRKIKELEEKINQQEDYSRRKNVRISGVEERAINETWEQTATTVTSLLGSKMQLPGVVLERAHRVGPRRDNMPRTVMVKSPATL
ncbi:hypothetical protein Pcinc_001923 [Petrolisthes cinctipes]|uniref:Uncharacterized protein n=1 Tax=Petrolisthes cinctipes TaxID=88211 RepID=A0AAE1FYN3_PETCI|nr:hypothetical protein Pcinc_013559 [Petrolisthes cinctipes]KAK3882040.1 hypothetical protein Pcinc_013564 [Petrolisthes cinctipes]KAK3894312.1 hypothetical protein Pcinc_001923 [Petrolisthes cinctipes]